MSTKNNNAEMKLNVTESILRVYDGGVTSPSAILSQLCYSFPVLTLATIKRVIDIHRAGRSNRPAYTPKPKVLTPADELREEIRERCAHCKFHQSMRPCVMPWGLCPFEDMEEKIAEQKRLEQEERSKKATAPVLGGHIEYRRKPRVGDSCEDFERELDEQLGEKQIQEETERAPLIAGETINSELLGEAVFRPDTPISLPKMGKDWHPLMAEEPNAGAGVPAEAETYMEDVLSILNPSIRRKVLRSRPKPQGDSAT